MRAEKKENRNALLIEVQQVVAFPTPCTGGGRAPRGRALVSGIAGVWTGAALKERVEQYRDKRDV